MALVSSGIFWLSVPRSGLASTATTRSPRSEAKVAPRRGGHRGLADAALEAQHRDLVAAQQRLVDPRGELAAADVGGALPRVEHPPGQHVDHAAPAALRRPLGVAEQPCGGEVGALGAPRALRLLCGDGDGVRPVGVAHGGARGLRAGPPAGPPRAVRRRTRPGACRRAGAVGCGRYGSSRRRQPGPGQPCAGRAPVPDGSPRWSRGMGPETGSSAPWWRWATGSSAPRWSRRGTGPETGSSMPR